MIRRKPSSKSKPYGYLQRSIDVREVRDRLLIVCEGERTEPAYFRSFRVTNAVVQVLGYGYNTIALVEKAIELKQQEEYDQTWCVLDRNSFPIQNFNRALSLAEQNRIRVAYSNEAFEHWYLLHFNYYDTQLSRSQYCEKLSELLRFKYRKNLENMYELSSSRQAVAIRNATTLLEKHGPLDASHANPSTTVHLLVEELNRYLI